MIKGCSCCAVLSFALVLAGAPFANAEYSHSSFQIDEHLIAAKVENHYLVKMQGIRYGNKQSKSANIWSSTQEEAISKAIKIWEQNSFQNIQIIEVRKLN